MIAVRTIALWLLLASLNGCEGCDCSADHHLEDAAAADATSGDGALNDDSGSLDASGDAADVTDAGTDATAEPLDASYALACQGSECNLVTNGCDTGEACYFLPPQVNEQAEPMCFAAGDNGPGTICSGQEQCAPGLGCDPANRCRNYCCAPGETYGCPNGQACLVEFRDGNDQSAGVGLCQDCDVCDPVTSVGCAGNQACYPASNDGACQLCLTPRSNGNIGASCTTSSDCRRGLGCALFDPPQCAKFCSVSAGTGCNAGQTCDAIGYTGLPDLGFCTSP